MIENTIYDIIENYKITTDTYSPEGIQVIEHFLNALRRINPSFQFHEIYSSFPDESGAFISFCWIEDEKLYHIVLTERR